MLSRLFRSDSNVGFRYVIFTVFIVALFVIGYMVGNLANTVFQSRTQSASNAAIKPTGGALVDPPHLLQDFTLTSQSGEPISLRSLRGRAAVLFFGYTHCPEECPTTVANFRRARQMLGNQADQVAFVFISVDGKRDTPAQLAHFLSQFDSDFIGMTGDEATLRRIGSEYGLIFSQATITVPTGSADHEDEHDPALDQQNYFVQHTSPSFLIDADGYLRMVFFYGTSAEVITDGVRQILGS